MVYDPESILQDALENFASDFPKVLKHTYVARIVIYIGSTFQAKKYLLRNARRIIDQFINHRYPNIQKIKVTIANDSDLWGSTDLHIWVLAGI